MRSLAAFSAGWNRGVSLAALIRALFSGDTQGVWFDNSDFATLYQDANGVTPVTTFGDPVRLALDKSQGLVLGPELVTDPNFDNAESWTIISANWSVSGGVASATGASTNLGGVIEVATTVVGRTYLLEMGILSITGSVAFRTGSGRSPSLSTTGTHRFYYVATETSTSFGVCATGTSVTATLSNISVRELPGTHALAPSDAARPLVVEVDGNIAIRRDLIDDQLDVTLPAITNGKIIIGTTEGVWVDDLNFAGGTFSLGPTTYTGGPAGLYDAIGADELGTIILDRQPTEAELDNIMKWFKSKGAPGRFVLGDELVTNGTFDTDTSGWTLVVAPNGNQSVVDGRLRVTSVAPDNHARSSQGIETVVGTFYLATATGYFGTATQAPQFKIGISQGSGQNIFKDFGDGETITSVFEATSTATFVTLQTNQQGVYSEFDNTSVRPLTVEPF